MDYRSIPQSQNYNYNKTLCANITYNHRIRKSDIVTFLRQTDFSPVPFTWIQTINNRLFTNWPVLTSNLIHKHLPKLMATSKVRLRLIKQNIQSTKPKPVTQQQKPCIMTAPTARTNEVFFRPMHITGKISTNQTGQFPKTSSTGSKYIIVLCIGSKCNIS